VIDPEFAIVGAMLPVVGGVHYALDTLKGITRPNRASWLLWSIAPAIAFVAELAQHTPIEIAALTLAFSFASFMVVLASFANPQAYWKITRFDIACGLLALIALCLWAITGQGNIAIICAIIIDFLASLPTIGKLYHHSESERGIVYVACIAGALITLGTIKTWTFASYGVPLYYLVIDSVLLAAMLLPSRNRSFPVLSADKNPQDPASK